MAVGNAMAQLAHAAIEAGNHFNQPEETPYAYILGVDNEEDLITVSRKLDNEGIRYRLFYEPDFPRGHTALVTEPLDSKHKKIFKKYKLY